jgi:transcriptional regulator with XRE-family HTH domain
MPFHENLRTLRLARGLTQPTLAEKAGIEQSYLSKLENGRSKPSEDVLGRLAQALEVKPEALANGDETEDRTRRWQRAALAAAAVLALGLAFLLGRATAVYPLSFGQVIRGADASADLTLQLRKLAPDGLEITMLSRNGPAGERIFMRGDADDMGKLDDYMATVRKRYGGSFLNIEVGQRVPGRLQDFSLEYQLGNAR